MSNGVGESIPVTIPDSNIDIPDSKRSSANKVKSEKLETKKKPTEKSPSNKLRSRSTVTKKSGSGKHKSCTSCNIKSEPQPWESFSFTPSPNGWCQSFGNEEIPSNEESCCMMNENTMPGYTSPSESDNITTKTFEFGAGFIPFLGNHFKRNDHKRNKKKNHKKVVFNLYI